MKNMNKKTSWHTCLNCKELQKSCCTLGVPLTMQDIRLIELLGFKLDEFAEPEEWYKDEIEGCEDWWEASMAKIDGKMFRLHIKEKKDGNCFFLKHGEGCILGDNRPLHCKIYPFWVDEETNIVEYDDQDEKHCHFHRNGTPLKEGVKLVNETEETVKEYFSKIKADCIKNKDKYKEIILKLLKK